jgi:class 3 adenylate cyclase/GAF domain-containing protein
MTERGSALVTVLFTDLVGSTELLSRAGDEEAQRIFRAHHDLLAGAATARGGEEVKWLGDGLMVAFASAADAVEAAIAMQQAARRPVQGEQLAIRVGLNAGESLREAADYFGLPVVVARRLCDEADGGQILCTDVVTELLAGRQGFDFESVGFLELKGVPQPVAAYGVRYETTAAGLVPPRAPVVGRVAELGRLDQRWAAAVAGRGGLVLVAGEPGIGKTRLAEELGEQAAHHGAEVLWGHCFEGDWVPPYAPFAEALVQLVNSADPVELQVDLGEGGPALAPLVPALRSAVPNLTDPAPLQSDEERFRVLDAMARLLAARSARAPVLLCLDDLQWADRGTVAMLRHLARFAAHQRLLVVGAYRDVEIDPTHPLAQAFASFHRETTFEVIELNGLGAAAVADLLAALGGHDVPEKVGAAWACETDGNPFFVMELLRHLIEEGKVFRGPDARWTTERPLRELDPPRSVREVIGRRLAHLSGEAKRLLSVASAFEGPFHLALISRLAEVGEDAALDALDEALAAQLLEPAGGLDVYGFSHAPIRHTIYGELSPSRRVRLHRRVAEALEAVYGAEPTPAQAGEIAAQYQRSAELPGAERGVDFALAAATHAETAGAHDDAARFLRTGLELLPAGDDHRPRLLGRLGIALAWAAAFDEAVEVASEAGEAIAMAEGAEAATDYLTEALSSCLENIDRLAALRGTGLLDAPRRADLDRLTAEAAKRLGTPIAIMSLVDDQRQFFASQYGLSGEVAEKRQTPVEYSHCKFVAAFAAPFRVGNALTNPLVRELPGVTQRGFRSYLGIPLLTKEGQALGSFCVVDREPRQWSPDDEKVLEELAHQALALAEQPPEDTAEGA